jgi:hypothetical protein
MGVAAHERRRLGHDVHRSGEAAGLGPVDGDLIVCHREASEDPVAGETTL